MKKVLMVLFVMVLVLFSNTTVDAMVDFQEECINKQKCVSKEFDGVCKCDYYGSKR